MNSVVSTKYKGTYARAQPGVHEFSRAQQKNTFLPDRGVPVLTAPGTDSGHRVAVAPPAPLYRKRWGGAVSRGLQRPPSPPHAPPGKPGAHEGRPPAPRGACRDPQGSPERTGTHAFHATGPPWPTTWRVTDRRVTFHLRNISQVRNKMMLNVRNKIMGAGPRRPM